MDWSNEQGEEAERESETVFAITGNIFFPGNVITSQDCYGWNLDNIFQLLSTSKCEIWKTIKHVFNRVVN